MKMLILASTYPVSLEDGTPRFVHDLANTLAGHASVQVVAPGAPNAASKEQLEAVAVRRFTYFWPRRLQRLTPGIVDNLRRSWLARLQVPGFLLAEMITTWDQLRKQNPDVVNAHWLVPQGLVAALLRPTFRNSRLILHAHAGDVDLLARFPFGRALARFVVARSDIVFTASDQVGARLDALLGEPSGWRTRSMGVAVERFRDSRPVDSPFAGGYLLFVGRLVPKKGLTYLLAAMTSVVAAHADLGLVVVGDGPDRAVLERQVEELGLADSVAFVGSQSHEVLAGYLAGAAAVIVPSIVDDRGETEGLPTVIVEAMACGAPVVSTGVAGIPELVRPDVSGWLCPQRDAQALAEAIDAVLSGDDVTEIVERSRAIAQGYSWECVAGDYLDAMAPEVTP